MSNCLYFSAKRNMLKRCVDFSVHMKKQSLMVKCPVEGASTNEILDLSEMVPTFIIYCRYLLTIKYVSTNYR